MPSTSSVVGVAGRYAAAELPRNRKNSRYRGGCHRRFGRCTESSDLRRLVASPVIGREEQGQAIAAVLEKAGISELTRNFVGVVAKNRRLFALDDMCVAYRDLLSSRRGEMTAEVTSAQPLTDDQRASLEQELRTAMGSKVTLDAVVDQSLSVAWSSKSIPHG